MSLTATSKLNAGNNITLKCTIFILKTEYEIKIKSSIYRDRQIALAICRSHSTIPFD